MCSHSSGSEEGVCAGATCGDRAAAVHVRHTFADGRAGTPAIEDLGE
jgi:hypothetical protein